MKDGRFPLSILFYAEGLPFHSGPIEHQSLGGSESALWHMARELAKRGHLVDVCCHCPYPGNLEESNGVTVTYYDLATFPQLQLSKEYDLVIVSRYFPVLARPLRSKMNWLWLHDMPQGPQSARQMASNLFQTEQVMVLSNFQRQAYLKDCPELEPLLWNTTNGVDLGLMRKYGIGKRRPKQLIYASRPERGLDYLLAVIWPQLLAQDPELELWVCGYDVKSYPFNDEMRQFYEQVDQLVAHTPRVTNLGTLGKADFYLRLSQCALMVAPTAFPEISMINAIESMAAGTPIVTTNNFALTETIPYAGIEGLPREPGYAERFIARTLELLNDDVKYRQIRNQGKIWIESKYQWKQVAEKWEDRAFELFERRLQQHPVAIARGLLWNSDVVLARDLAADVEEDDMLAILIEADHALAHHHEDPDAYFDHAKPGAEWAQPNARYQHVIDLVPATATSLRPLRVADVGCGSGGLLGQLCHQRPDVDGYGFDFSEKLVAAAIDLAYRHQVGNVVFQQKDVIGDDDIRHVNGYDVMIAGEILEHIPDYWTLIEKIEHACCVGGTIILTVPSGPWEANSYNESYDPQTGYPTRYHVHHFELRDLQDIFGEKLQLQIEYRNGGFSVQGEPLGWWFIRYQHDPTRKTGRVNVQRKILTAKPRQTIAACLIVKNEAKNLQRCLDSVVPYVDELWIWDCGSTDNTIFIAENYSMQYTPRLQVRILNINPDGDGIPNFAAWRNESIGETNADWIAWCDADEILYGGQNLRKYTTPCSLFNAYVIKQNHLVFKQQFIPADLPQRLFRNHKGYQFWACIHEQPGVTLNDEIQPSLCLPDVDIIHFGYVTAEDTRWKCFDRNMPALLKDRKLNPTRHLGPLLVMRDGLNKAQYLLEHSGLQMTDEILLLVRSAAIVFLQHYADPKDKYHGYAFTFYQLALRALGVRGIPLVDGGTPPFEVKVQMAIGVGGLDDRPLAQPPSRWFHSPQEYNEFLMEQSDAALAPMIAQAERYAEQTHASPTGSTSPALVEQSEELLRDAGDPVSGLGAHIYVTSTGATDSGPGRAGDGGDPGGDSAPQ